MPRYDIFLAHAGADTTIAVALGARLAPLRVFLDVSSLALGDRWRDQIADAFGDCELFVPLLTGASSHYFGAELDAAIRGNLKIVPVWLGPVEGISRGAYAMNTISGIKAEDGDLDAVAARLRALVRGPAPAWRELVPEDLAGLSTLLAETVADDQVGAKPATPDGRRWQVHLAERYHSGTLPELLDRIWPTCADPTRLKEFAGA